ncbi:MAG: nucleoside triphosphate pyrophosphohydrolase [Alphaproteobacteria bacterium]|nr:nucleoside triphosphate pyrophosphohydrolase [Alphaproteobacteria bacterium]
MSTHIDQLLAVMAKLRDPDGGCPWDLEQSFATIAPYTIEEAYEVAEAIDHGDMDALKDELGDLLLQVVFHAQMAAENGLFDFEAVAQGISDKMIRRHPHVFGDQSIESAAAQTAAWEDHKAAERLAMADAQGRDASVLGGVSIALPGLTRAVKLARRAARVGFDWPHIAGVLAKVEEEVAELRSEIEGGRAADRLEDEIGDLLFSVANLARHLSIEPEAAIRRANRKFQDRFHHVEAALKAQGRHPQDAGLEELDRLWNAAKRASDAALPR